MARQGLEVQGKEKLLKALQSRGRGRMAELLTISPGNQAGCHLSQLPTCPLPWVSSGQADSGQPGSIWIS